MKDYKNYIENLASSKESLLFFNSGPYHAAIVMSTIFKYADKEIKILAGNLNSGVSRDKSYQKNLCNFLDKGGILKIVLDEYNPNTINAEIRKILKEYQFFNPENISVRQSEYSVINPETKGSKIHFTVADDKIYRLEDDTVNFKARGSFQDSEYSKKLSTLFDTLSDNQYSQPVIFN